MPLYAFTTEDIGVHDDGHGAISTLVTYCNELGADDIAMRLDQAGTNGALRQATFDALQVLDDLTKPDLAWDIKNGELRLERG
jgi:hypothetical protein